jgi:hypothetical protein
VTAWTRNILFSRIDFLRVCFIIIKGVVVVQSLVRSHIAIWWLEQRCCLHWWDHRLSSEEIGPEEHILSYHPWTWRVCLHHGAALWITLSNCHGYVRDVEHWELVSSPHTSLQPLTIVFFSDAWFPVSLLAGGLRVFLKLSRSIIRYKRRFLILYPCTRTVPFPLFSWDVSS